MPHTAPPTPRKADPLPSPVIWAFNISLRGACSKTSSISCTQKPGCQAALDKLEFTEPSLLPTPPPREVGGGLKSQVIGPRSLCEHPARTDSSWCGILTTLPYPTPHSPQPLPVVPSFTPWLPSPSPTLGACRIGSPLGSHHPPGTLW